MAKPYKRIKTTYKGINFFSYKYNINKNDLNPNITKDVFLEHFFNRYDFYFDDIKTVLYPNNEQKTFYELKGSNGYKLWIPIEGINHLDLKRIDDKKYYNLLCLPGEDLYSFELSNYTSKSLNNTNSGYDSLIKNNNDLKENEYCFRKHEISKIEIIHGDIITYYYKKTYNARINILNFKYDNITYNTKYEHHNDFEIYIESVQIANKFGCNFKNRGYETYTPGEYFSEGIACTNDLQDLIKVFTKHYFHYNLRV